MNKTKSYKKLSEIPSGSEVFIAGTDGHQLINKRLAEMGFIKGKSIKVIKNAPLLDPIEYQILGYNVSLRRQEANHISVVDNLNQLDISEHLSSEIIDHDIDYVLKSDLNRIFKEKEIKIALVGNPNCGKTTLFNFISKSRQRVGNYVGVTVEATKTNIKKQGYNIEITDLPGTYSIFEFSPEELYVRNHIIETKPDIVINVVDASNLERNLFLTTQLLELDVHLIIVLNMIDAIEEKGDKIDYFKLEKQLGLPVIPTIASKGIGTEELINAIINTYDNKISSAEKNNLKYHLVIENSIGNLEKEIIDHNILINKHSPRFTAIKLLESDNYISNLISENKNSTNLLKILSNEREKLDEIFGEKSESLVVRAKYDYISEVVKNTYKSNSNQDQKIKFNIDDILTHKYLGYPIFIFFMWMMFQSTFTLGSYPMDWIDGGVKLLSDFLKNNLSTGPLRDLILDGIIAGVGGVIVFLPNILILFFFISIMEDTGYMARASFIMDKLMHKIGLHGKSFIPLIMGFGCNVPAIMASKTIDNRKDRILTMMITPLMSCSARLPVYLLIISAIFTKWQGTILLSIYIVGVVLAILVAKVVSKFSYKKEVTPFVLELPPYRIPTIKNVLIHMWDKGSQYLNKMGTIILTASILIWALGYFPKDKQIENKYDSQIEMVEKNTSISESSKQISLKTLQSNKTSELQEKSFIGIIGKAIEPAIRPLGFDWKIGVSIISGLAAKEIVLSTMGTLYHSSGIENIDDNSLSNKIKEQRFTSGPKLGERVFTPLTAFSFMIFILIYFPCVAVIAAIKKESSWKYAIITMVYTTALAWSISYLVYNIGKLFIN